ncbi:hypothetical protein wTpre_536 [Wolbachia endosymbiont of Trichogramma pretiosum]|nr:hypothetical protein wTpre_536 [Wolbachia endosymbiont of Trichogramma pretiosum]
MICQKKIVNALKSEVKKLKYADLKSISIKSDSWNFSCKTYIDLGRSHNLTIMRKKCLMSLSRSYIQNIKISF